MGSNDKYHSIRSPLGQAEGGKLGVTTEIGEGRRQKRHDLPHEDIASVADVDVVAGGHRCSGLSNIPQD